MTHERPQIDDRDPADAIDQMVDHVMLLAESWTHWDGKPVLSGDRIYTPHKAIRRVADHLLDHLAQLDAHLTGASPRPDRWHGSAVTTPTDLAPFIAEDRDEARSRLERLAQLWRTRLATVPADTMDRAEGDDYTPREMAFCAAGSDFYADAIGTLK
jgi:hypothetical protein